MRNESKCQVLSEEELDALLDQNGPEALVECEGGLGEMEVYKWKMWEERMRRNQP